MEQMEQEIKVYKIDSWKWYCHTDPGQSGNGFRLDDEKLTYPFYEGPAARLEDFLCTQGLAAHRGRLAISPIRRMSRKRHW